MEGRKLDQILELSLLFTNGIQPHQIKEELFPELNNEQIGELILNIRSLNPKISEVYEGNIGIILTKNGLTKSFLDNGGFTKMENDLIWENNKIKEREEIEFKKSKIDLELSKKILEEFPRTKWFARIGFIISIILLLKEVLLLII